MWRSERDVQVLFRTVGKYECFDVVIVCRTRNDVDSVRHGFVVRHFYVGYDAAVMVTATPDQDRGWTYGDSDLRPLRRSLVEYHLKWQPGMIISRNRQLIR